MVERVVSNEIGGLVGRGDGRSGRSDDRRGQEQWITKLEPLSSGQGLSSTAGALVVRAGASNTVAAAMEALRGHSRQRFASGRRCWNRVQIAESANPTCGHIDLEQCANNICRMQAAWKKWHN